MKSQLCAAAIFLTAISATAVFSSATASAQAVATPKLKYRIIVNQGKWDQIKTNQWNLPPEVAAAIQDQFVEKLQHSGSFIVVVQDDTDADKTRSDADFVLTPVNIDYSETKVSKKGLNIGDVRLGGDFGEAKATITVQISDAKTDEFLDLETSTGKIHIKSNHDEDSLVGVAFTDDQFLATPAGKAVDTALDSAVTKASARLSREPWNAFVAAQDDTTGRVVINAGYIAGVVVGELFDIYQPGTPILDPVTGATISQGDPTIVGRVRVVRTERYASYCDVVTGSKFDIKDIVKPAT